MAYSAGQAAQKEEAALQDWSKKSSALEQEALKQIDEWLFLNSPQSREDLRALFQNAGFLSAFDTRTKMGYLRVVMQIYEKELQAGEERTVLDMGVGHEELTEQLMRIKFLLWRIVFAKDRQAERELPSVVRRSHLSPYYVQKMVSIAAVKKKEALLQLAELFLERRMYRHTYHMLDYLTRLFPGEEDVLCLAAEFCGEIGNRKQAAAYLEKVGQPGEWTERVRKQYGC